MVDKMVNWEKFISKETSAGEALQIVEAFKLPNDEQQRFEILSKMNFSIYSFDNMHNDWLVKSDNKNPDGNIVSSYIGIYRDEDFNQKYKKL